jgi:hypothetical protein
MPASHPALRAARRRARTQSYEKASRHEAGARCWQRYCESPHELKPAAAGDIVLLLRVVAPVAAECPSRSEP